MIIIIHHFLESYDYYSARTTLICTFRLISPNFRILRKSCSDLEGINNNSSYLFNFILFISHKIYTNYCKNVVNVLVQFL